MRFIGANTMIYIQIQEVMKQKKSHGAEKLPYVKWQLQQALAAPPYSAL